MPSPEAVLRSLGGVGTTFELREVGVTATAVRRGLTEGRVQRIRRGYYSVPDALPAAVGAVRVGGRLAGASAVRSYGGWGGWSDTVEVIVPKNAARMRTNEPPSLIVPGHVLRDDRWGMPVRLHWRDDPLDQVSCWRVSLFRALRQTLLWNDTETAVACIETCLDRRLLTPGDLDLLAAGAADHAGRASGIVACCTPGSGSGVESIVFHRLSARGVRLQKQARIEGVGRVDLLVVGTRILIETDGFEFHRSREAFAEDRRRDAEASAQGYVTLRFTAVQVRDEWAWVESMVFAALREGSR